MYSVIVSNVGTVFESADRAAATREFDRWCFASRSHRGDRAYGETVTLTDPSGAPIMEYRKRGPLPTVKDLSGLIVEIKRAGIDDDFRAYEDDEEPGILLTVGWDPVSGDWSYQTGDNSFTGGAYGYPVWASVAIHRRSRAADLAREIRSQLQEGAAD